MLTMALLVVHALASTPPQEPDIVVVGERLGRLSVNVGRDAKGRMTCGLSESSGSARLDRRLCKEASACVRSGAQERDAIAACIDARKPHLLDDLRRVRDDNG